MELFSEANKIEIEIYDTLKNIIDPELGINIVDLGLIYEIIFDSDNVIQIKMTLSSKGCPMGDVIMDNINNELSEKFPQFKHNVELIWEPKWTTDYVTPEGRKELGIT